MDQFLSSLAASQQNAGLFETPPVRGQDNLMPERSIGNESGQTGSSAQARFEQYAMPHVNDIFRTASRVLGDRNRAEDVAQEVYFRAWKSFGNFEAGTNCRAWLFKILFHCISHHRRRWFRFPQFDKSEEYLEANLTYSPPIAEHITDTDILSALERIPAEFRSVVLLVDVEEFLYKEVAEILDVPIGTVMSRLNRGRRQLREQLKHVAEEYGIKKKATGGSQ